MSIKAFEDEQVVASIPWHSASRRLRSPVRHRLIDITRFSSSLSGAGSSGHLRAIVGRRLSGFSGTRRSSATLWSMPGRAALPPNAGGDHWNNGLVSLHTGNRRAGSPAGRLPAADLSRPTADGDGATATGPLFEAPHDVIRHPDDRGATLNTARGGTIPILTASRRASDAKFASSGHTRRGPILLESATIGPHSYLAVPSRGPRPGAGTCRA
jgi:hypothetical protein